MNEQAETKRPYRFYKVLTWALLGAVLVYIVCAMSLTSEHTWETPFYNAGDISEVSINPFRREAVQDGGTQEADGTVTLEQGSFRYTLSFKGYSEDWQYFCIRIDDLTADTLAATATYEQVVDGAVEGSVTQTYTLTEGMNVLTLPDPEFSRVRLSFRGASGTSFVVGKLQFQENPPISVTGLTVLWGVLTAAAYLVLSGILRTIYKRTQHKGRIRPYVAIEMLQELYLVVAGRLAAFEGKLHICKKRRRIIRTCLFLGLFCYTMWVAIAGNYYASFSLHSMVYAAILSAIAVLSIEGTPKKKNWNNPLVWSWLILLVMMCVSDCVVPKNTGTPRFWGYVILFFIGFFIFVWNNMEDRGEIIEDFVRAIHIFFWIALVYCIFCRPDSADIRYSGFVTNPNGWGKYMAAFWAVVLGSLDYAIRTQKKRRELFLYIVEACLVFSMAWKAQSVTVLLVMALIVIFWLVRMIICAFRGHRKKALTGVIVCALVLFLPLHIGLSEGLLHVPNALGTAVAYEDDVRIERTTFGTVAYAAETEDASAKNLFTDNRLFQKITSSSLAGATAGRTYIYKEYLRDLNWFGHSGRPYMALTNQRPHPHNEVLGRAYYYGIFAAIPYIIMLIAVLARTWRFSRTKAKYAVVPLFACMAFVVISMADVADAPFHRLIWDCMYLLMGCAFCEEDLVGDADDLCYHQRIESARENSAQAEKGNTVGEKI